MIRKRKDLLSMTTKIDDFIKRVESTAEGDLFTPRIFYRLSEPMFDEMCELLKEHEAVEPINSYGTFRCGNCTNIVGYYDGYWRGYRNNFCSKCGKAVKWNE